ncbi:hypothetical protein TIFTF001_043818 [Ficus carica]|uniref:Uncharacterized protein n=1 Tax=Ficus carica TaxID=3494 RepID=A0AA88CKH4_FICCA|nr:hypothetical protein TIFTF001_043818 [Ficus carica]
MVADGEERERESVWATQGEREAAGGLGDGEEREREAVGATEGEREREKFAWRRQGERERKLREWMETAKSEIEH